ncbi:MAG: 4Fe-4S dicluster domain-containing protein [Chloroflexota bacterium]
MNLNVLYGFVKTVIGNGGVSGVRPLLENAEREVAHLGQLVTAGDYAVSRLDTAPPGKGVNVMINDMPLSEKLTVLPIMFRVIDSVVTCGHYMKDKLSPTKHIYDADVMATVETLLRDNGAVEVGFTKISEHDIFKDCAIPYQNAIVFTMDMKKDAIDTAPSHDALKEVLGTYASLGKNAVRVTEYLRDAGYGAYPGFPIGGLVDYVRVGQDAGIGGIGYHGMLISPSDGTRQRINVIFTNMDLPEQASANPHEWILDFCAMCNKCVRNCPPEAIYTDATPHPETGRKITIDYDKCVTYYGENQGCAVCVKVCPFSQAGYEKIEDGFLKAQAKRLARQGA